MKRLLFFLTLLAVAGYVVHRRDPEQYQAATVVYPGPPPGLPGPVAGGDRARDARWHPPLALIDQRESVDGIPVPIVAGTRVDRAEIGPPQPPVPPRRPIAPRSPEAARPPAHSTVRTATTPGRKVIAGRLSATEDRAREDARLQLEAAVAEWLAPEVPASWKVPTPMIDAIGPTVEVRAVEKELGTLYEGTIPADFSPAPRTAILEIYRREMIAHRLTVLGGVLAFVLACLAVLAGYIRADEATKGYYTNSLRVAAAAGVGASGVLIYQFLA